jgi:hypothetical protein
MPIQVSVVCQLRFYPLSDMRLTSAYNLLLRPPLSQDREQKCQRIRNRHRETQFRLAYQDEEPHTARYVQQQRHGICGSTQDACHGVEKTQYLLLEPGIIRVCEGGARWWVVVPGFMLLESAAMVYVMGR